MLNMHYIEGVEVKFNCVDEVQSKDIKICISDDWTYISYFTYFNDAGDEEAGDYNINVENVEYFKDSKNGKILTLDDVLNNYVEVESPTYTMEELADTERHNDDKILQ